LIGFFEDMIRYLDQSNLPGLRVLGYLDSEMSDMPESTLNLLFSGIMGIIGGMLTIPVSALFSYWLKRDELNLHHRLDIVAKQRELLLQHQLELERIEKEHQLAMLLKQPGRDKE
jgi:hypothetical protein